MKNNSNTLRGIIGLIIALVILFASVRYANRLADAKAKPQTKNDESITKVYTQVVTNGEVPISLYEKGTLQAFKKVELYSEVQGILQSTSRLFKPGEAYAAGSVILSIDDTEFKAGLVSQKSVLYNQIAQIMPDLRLDYPDVFEKWQDFLNRFDIHKTTPELPAFDSDREKFFINSKNIVTTYYNIKNLEERHKKYKLFAPFACVVTESLVNPGTLVRPGQKLGEIISPTTYELAISINDSYKDYIKIGRKVDLTNLDRSRSWTGSITRIDPTVNTTTQGVLAYITVSGSGLQQGMFLEAEVRAKPIERGFEIPRKLLVDNTKTYVVKDSALHLQPLDIAFFKEETAVVTNLPDGAVLLKFPMPGAYEGMRVEQIQ